jgi:proteasome accessory factor A
LFADVVKWGRSSNVFIANASRLYLDVGSHPEYATAECDSVPQLIAYDRAGQAILAEMAAATSARLAADGRAGALHLFKNNTDSAGHSFGAHENYLVRRDVDFPRLQRVLIPFLVTRQVLCGAGKILVSPHGARFVLSQRADHVWEEVSSATTRSRPMINTRDEAHADASKYRRLHVIVGDSSMSQTTALLKIGALDLVLRLVEAGAVFPDLALDNPTQAIRALSHDPTGLAPLALADGRELSGLDIQEAYLERVVRHVFDVGDVTATDTAVLDLWRRGVDALRAGEPGRVATELDWVIKRTLLDRYRERTGASLLDPRVQRLELAYHDIGPAGLFARLEEDGLAARAVEPAAVAQAQTTPPPTTRAALRGRFIAAARAAGRDYSVDWVHLRLGDGDARVVALLDPFKNADERVDALIAAIGNGSAQNNKEGR